MTPLSSTTFVYVVALACVVPAPQASAAQAQSSAGSGDTVQLATLQQQALDADPRVRELRLEAAKSELSLRNIAATTLPSVTLNGQVQYQSDVPTPPALLPSGQPLFSAPKDTYDAFLRVDQSLIDRTTAPRLAEQRAELAEAQARIRTTLFGLRQEVNDAFFGAALMQERARSLAATIADLEGRLRETNLRVREGTVLPDESSIVEATLLLRQQDLAEARLNQRAALARLGKLVGHQIGETEVLALPELEQSVVGARAALAVITTRPEYRQFATTRDRLAAQQAVAAAEDKPRVSAFARAGYARPGLNFVSDRFEAYWLGGLQFQWKAWNWGTVDRERESLSLQQQIVRADEAAFGEGIQRAVENDLANIDRLGQALTADDRIVALREGIDRSALARFREGVISASEYLDRETELLEARFARDGHRIELAQTSARFLTTLGRDLQ
jgi:outer membrane protein TolC